uniref:C2 domain-containing protein n=1 Tax=Tetraselmis sp. GSL018 TaxID=582737 RepID=A0A061RM65_9CHLO
MTDKYSSSETCQRRLISDSRRNSVPGVQFLLRAVVVKLRTQDARRYHLRLDVRPVETALDGEHPGSEQAAHRGGGSPGTGGRTETSVESCAPEFLNNAFYLRIPPAPLRRAAGSVEGSPPAAILRLVLMAAEVPTDDNGTQHEVVASAELPIQDELAARLLSGHRHRQTLRMRPLDNKGADPGGPALGLGATKATVDVDLQIVDCGAPPGSHGSAQSTPSTRNSVYTAPFSPSTHSFLRADTEMSSPRGPSRQCTLMVLVSRAEHLPQVHCGDGARRPPSAFVAVKTVRQAKQRVASSSFTSAVEDSCNPVWDERLQLAYSENDVPKERVLIALVNWQTSRLMYKCSIPIFKLHSGRHYNLALSLGRPRGRSASRSPRLFVTLCLVDYLAGETRRWKALAGANLLRIQASVLSLSSPLAMDGSGGVGALWKLVGDAGLAMEEPPPNAEEPPGDIHVALSADDEASMSSEIEAMGATASGAIGEVSVAGVTPRGSACCWVGDGGECGSRARPGAAEPLAAGCGRKGIQ